MFKTLAYIIRTNTAFSNKDDSNTIIYDMCKSSQSCHECRLCVDNRERHRWYCYNNELTSKLSRLKILYNKKEG